MSDAAGRDGPRYVLHQRLAAGGMGVVHLGTLVTPAGRRRVAIKQLSSDRTTVAWRDRLIAEARLAFRLTHGNICQVFDLGENPEGTFIVLEYVNGMDLRALQRELKLPLDPAVAIYIAREVARGLDYAHRKRDDDGFALGLVHGDVTPQNILVSFEGEVKLCDFGIARALGAPGPGDALRGGTPGWVAPEAVGEGAIDHRADLYGLGVTTYAMLSARRPPEGTLPPDALARARPDLGPELARIVARLTAARPEDRFTSAGEAEQELAFELARRNPGFTPVELARLVREHVRPVETSPVEEGTLSSLSGSHTIPDDGADVVVAPRALGTPRPRHPGGRGPALPETESQVTPSPKTLTVVAGARARRFGRSQVVGLGLLAFAGLGGAFAWSRLRAGAEGGASDAAGVAGIATDPPVDAAPLAVAPSPTPTPMPSSLPDAAPEAVVGLTPSPTSTPPPSPPPTRPPSRARPPRRGRPPVEVGTAYLTISSRPWGAVYVDGRKVADETPVYRLEVPAGRHQVKVYFPDRGAFSTVRSVDLAAGAERSLGFSP